MRVVVTGAAGFVGRALIKQLVVDHQLVAVDRNCSVLDAGPNLRCVEGDLADPEILKKALEDGCDAVVHLATIPGGASEEDPDTAWSVNVEASARLIALASRSGPRTRFLFASTIAALGEPSPGGVDDATPLRPTLLYGAHKAMVEQWLATQTRRGALRGLSLRLSGIVGRARATTGMKSAFLSEVFHAAHCGQPFESPMSAGATTWMMSLDRIVRNLCHGLEAEVADAEPFAMTLPAICASMGELVAEIARHKGINPSFVRFAPDAALEDMFGRFPPLDAAAARDAGYTDDGSIERLVAATFEHLQGGQ